MAITNIPGRRISYGETFYTDWGPRGGDCALLRAEVLVDYSEGAEVQVSLETRSEEAASPTTMDTLYPSGSPKRLVLSGVGVGTAIYAATTGSNSPARGFQEQVRAKIAFINGDAGNYFVIRLFPPVFFDNSVPGS